MTSEIPARPELGNVVVGVDGSPSGRTTVLWAAAEADRRGRPLHLVHAADTDRRASSPMPRRSRQYAKRAATC